MTEVVRKLHNPKSYAPAVYIPCWLIQISIHLLSHGAKLTYGRLSQWSDTLGHAYRSSKQLAEELGTSEKSIERYLKELRDKKLIGTYHPQAGGLNHFEFYDHPWMHDPIKDQLVYKQYKQPPPSDLREPPLGSEGTPPSDPRDINIKEIKEIKTNKHSPNLSSDEEGDCLKNNFINPEETQENPKSLKTNVCEKERNTACDRFNEFWSKYPKESRNAKKTCIAKWKRENLDSKADEILIALDRQILNDRKWLSGYIPSSLTYISQERWNDELDTRTRGTTGKQQSTDGFYSTMAKYKNILKLKDGYYDEHGNFIANYV